MINSEYVFDDIDAMRAIWIGDDSCEPSNLAKIVNFAIDENIALISAPPAATEQIWPWIENQKIEIFNRFDFIAGADAISAMSELSKNISMAFKNGASGVQVFVQQQSISNFVDMLMPVRDDLLFGHKFVLGLDIGEKIIPDWLSVFDAINKIKPDSLMIIAHGDTFDARSDFVGRIYGMLNNWNVRAALWVCFGKNMLRVSQVLRLCQKMRPELVENMRMFIDSRSIV